ncbi:MAG TPA: AraC family transcriptional regulator [Actinomycetota bacterium]|nr:AraC family transcriptional regulator [Actinomycetota bacterium]
MTMTADGLPSPHLQRKIHEVQAFLAQNLAYDVDLNTIAAQASLSPYYFTRQFTAMIGMPPYRYLITLRIQRAAQLLRESDLTVTQILHRVGFHSPSHFTTTFRRHMGMSPTAYRRRFDFEHNVNRFSRSVDPLVAVPNPRLTR